MTKTEFWFAIILLIAFAVGSILYLHTEPEMEPEMEPEIGTALYCELVEDEISCTES